MKYKIASVVFGTISLSTFFYHMVYKTHGHIDWFIVIPVLVFNFLAITMLWKLGTGVWISDEEHKTYKLAHEIVEAAIDEFLAKRAEVSEVSTDERRQK